MQTPQDLVKFLQELQGSDKKEDPSNYRYVIYTRKSTDEKGKQTRSLSDQINECRKIVAAKELKVVGEPIKEKESAKEPDIRPKFRAMLNDLRKGKYDGIVCWHPDRLARNMKDAGEIIDLIDKGIIKDIQFCSFIFENNTAGKMLLGIAFVLSKQYSDKLSDDITRGMRGSIEEGKWLHKPKHGYYKDRNKYLRPDGENFTIIKNAWKMRLENRKFSEIVGYLNAPETNYQIPTALGGKEHKPFRNFNERDLSIIFRDTFYCGVVVYGKTKPKVYDLTLVYDFTPMIGVEDFSKLNKFNDVRKIAIQRFKGLGGEIMADLLRRCVICGYCNEPMTAGITPKKSKAGTIRYYYYRCVTSDCKFRGKSIRARIIMDFVNEFLLKNKFNTKSVYKHYEKEMKNVIEAREQEVDQMRRSLIQQIASQESNHKKTMQLIIKEEDEEVKKEFKNELKSQKSAIEVLKSKLEEVKDVKKASEKTILSFEKFVELFDKLPSTITQIKLMKEKDFVIRKIFLNFVIKNKKVASYQLNSPFKEFIEKQQIPSCGDAGS